MTKRNLLTGCLLSGLLLLNSPILASDSAPLTKVPSNLAEIRDLQKKVQDVTKKVMSAVVGVQVGGASGSGVIVNEDGYVLTAGHVSGKPGQSVTLILPDGTRVKGKSLGQNKSIDSGMIKITDAPKSGKWPFVPMGDSSKLVKGQWCISLGHPGGYMEKRSPVLRLGRIIDANERIVQTDCTLVGGDSGGPLFDLDGNVIGIHSRIGQPITYNIHVPVSTFVDTWDGLAAGETDFTHKPTKLGLSLGLSFEKIGLRMKIVDVEKDSPAEKAGFKPKDYFAKLNDQEVATQDDIDNILKKKKPGDEVKVEVVRGAERLTLKVILGKKS